MEESDFHGKYCLSGVLLERCFTYGKCTRCRIKCEGKVLVIFWVKVNN